MSETTPLVSVIIPIYKVEQYLRLCVDSVLAQTHRNLEVILVDDGSPDGCPAICDEYARQDSRVRVIHQQNAGLSMARNAGIDVCTGAYITFVDSDDLLHERFVERLVAACETQKAEVAIGMFVQAPIAKNLLRVKETLPESPVRIVSGREANILMYHTWLEWVRMVMSTVKLYRRDCIGQERFPDVKLHEDEALTYKLLYNCEKVALVDDAVYYYNDNQGGLMANRYTPERMTMLDILDQRLAFYAAQGETGELIYNTLNRQFMFAAEYYQKLLCTVSGAKKFRRKVRKKEWAIYWQLLRSPFWLKRKLVYTYAMLMPRTFHKFYF